MKTKFGEITLPLKWRVVRTLYGPAIVAAFADKSDALGWIAHSAPYKAKHYQVVNTDTGEVDTLPEGNFHAEHTA